MNEEINYESRFNESHININISEENLNNLIFINPKGNPHYKHIKITDLNYSYASCSIYLFCAFLFIIWTISLLWERWNLIVSPVNTTGMDIIPYKELIFPAITICSLQNNLALKHNKCSSLNKEIDCEFSYNEYKIYKKLKAKANSCLTYNNKLNSAFSSINKGIDDMLFFSVKSESMNNGNFTKSLLSGVIIFLHSQEAYPLNENGIFLGSGEILNLNLKKVIHKSINDTTKETFEAQKSKFKSENFNKQWGDETSTYVISISYQDLNVVMIRELPSFDILTFLSDVGGIIGLLLGSSLINVLISIVQWCWGLSKYELDYVSIQKDSFSNINHNELYLSSNNLNKEDDLIVTGL